MPVPQPQTASPVGLRRRLERLDGLPLRPSTVRLLLASVTDDPGSAPDDRLDSPKFQAVAEVDPGWMLAQARWGASLDPLRLVEDRPWWPEASAAASEALGQLWKHSVAVAQASRRFAREVGDDDPNRVARAGLLHSLGLWSVAALEPDWLVRWLAEADPARRRAFESHSLGAELGTLGRTLAERWGCDPLVDDAAWLHADRAGGLNELASDPRRLSLVQTAYAWSARTPWSLGSAENREPAGSDPRLCLLIAEVQVRCASPFIEPDATPHEERLSRTNARLHRELIRARLERLVGDSLLRAMADSDPTEDPATWAERAGLAFCATPGIATARVVWTERESAEPSGNANPTPPSRAPERIVKLSAHGRRCAEVHLWKDTERPWSTEALDGVLPAWQAWAALVADRSRLDARLEMAVGVARRRVADDEPRLRESKLEALAEFAAGAGHELNNPLAVIVGRAQLLIAKETDPAVIRSLRAILAQAQRAHRILRDLMYVARPPEPRSRFCQPDEVMRACLRDHKADAEMRGVRLLGDDLATGPRVWADPDGLKQLADVLIRNALESTPKGGTIQVSSSGGPEALRWTVEDSGRGITAAEGQRLFDPFYCGRQAGRGLGLGLPRAARFVSQAGGELRWHSTPGQGTSFHVHLPLNPPPKPPSTDPEANLATSKPEPGLPKP